MGCNGTVDRAEAPHPNPQEHSCACLRDAKCSFCEWIKLDNTALMYEVLPWLCIFALNNLFCWDYIDKIEVLLFKKNRENNRSNLCLLSQRDNLSHSSSKDKPHIHQQRGQTTLTEFTGHYFELFKAEIVEGFSFLFI